MTNANKIFLLYNLLYFLKLFLIFSEGNKEKTRIIQVEVIFNLIPAYATPFTFEKTEYFSIELYTNIEKTKVFNL